jgi:hypothetical protein
MLDRLTKEIQILLNTKRFIKAIISETLKINKVKRFIVIQRLIELGLEPMSEISAIMAKYTNLGGKVTKAIDPQA